MFLFLMSTRFGYPRSLREIRDGRNMFEVPITMTVGIIVCLNVLIYQTARRNIPDDIFFMD
jgi:hypothetical protein